MAFKSLTIGAAALIAVATFLPDVVGARPGRTAQDDVSQYASGDHRERDRGGYRRDARDDSGRDRDDQRRGRSAGLRDDRCQRNSGTILSAVAGGLLGSPVTGRRGNHGPADQNC